MSIKSLTYAGHSAVLLETDRFTVGIDPWLEGNPRCPQQLLNPKDLKLIVLTHGHADHASDALRLAKSCNATIAATWELAMIMGREGVPESQLIPMNKGGTVEFEGLKVTLTHALHSSSYDTKSGPVYAGEACGAVVSDGRTTIYHAGDTALFSDMALIKEHYAPQVGLLPIGDRFTMGPKEAAHAAKLLGIKTAIPIHYATFGLLTGTAQDFSEQCRKVGVECVALEPGEAHTL